MHWIQDEQPVEYHVIRWRNSAFHNHDKLPKRKMLGGVSFDGGAGGGKSGNIQQAGVQNAQPSVPRDGGGNLFGSGFPEDRTERDGKTGGGPRSAAGTKAGGRGVLAAHNRDTLETGSIQEAMAVCQSAAADDAPDAAKAENAVAPVPEEKKKRPVFFHAFLRFGNGIRAFLRGTEQRAGREHVRKRPQKETPGTRAVTKEEFARMEQERTYLLDSYNKYGERSTLGRG
ncbi:MAG: hypothetical protein NC341_11515 [Blautia sp.]|nr:hypothetical protein [Blautia sp.]MCM1201685.1 hypothetical protein [Bacteroides fragilis]